MGDGGRINHRISFSQLRVLPGTNCQPIEWVPEISAMTLIKTAYSLPCLWQNFLPSFLQVFISSTFSSHTSLKQFTSHLLSLLCLFYFPPRSFAEGKWARRCRKHFRKPQKQSPICQFLHHCQLCSPVPRDVEWCLSTRHSPMWKTTAWPNGPPPGEQSLSL